MYDWQGIFSDLGKLLLAAFLGGLVGFERESSGQAAGFRTNLTVATGSCLIMLLSLHMEELFRYLDVNQSVVRLDPGRIASYAIAGMGFLGAGAIIKGKGSVRGLTTAAGLWAVTGIGLSIGAGYIIPTLFTTFIILAALYWVHPIRKLASHRIFSILTIKFKGVEDPFDQIKKIFSNYPTFTIRYINYTNETSSQTVIYRIRLVSKEEKERPQVVKRLSEMKGVEEIKWEESDVP
jgi:putative Mg2+ transporter-C (MgtC) family protein